MSVQVQLHVKTDDITEDHLIELGVYGPFAQLARKSLTSGRTHDAFDEATELTSEAPNHIVGDTTKEFPKRVLQLFDGERTVDETLIEQVRLLVDRHGGDRDEETVEWLSDHEEETVFAVGW